MQPHNDPDSDPEETLCPIGGFAATFPCHKSVSGLQTSCLLPALIEDTSNLLRYYMGLPVPPANPSSWFQISPSHYIAMSAITLSHAHILVDGSDDATNLITIDQFDQTLRGFEKCYWKCLTSLATVRRCHG
jgi:hypothetical protein